MIKRDVSHWEKNKYFNGMMLFAQTFEEATFHYSYESYKVPALNCHYLCYDIIQTAHDINRKTLMEGNFIPLSEEFEQMLNEDLFIKNCISNKGTVLFDKDRNGRCYDLSEGDLKSKIRRYPEIASYIRDVCEVKGEYLYELLNIIINNIFCDDFTYEKHEIVYITTRMLITDLVNRGYSKEYIYSSTIEFFFSLDKPVSCKIESIEKFFDYFTFEEYVYNSIFGINKKASIMLKKLENVVVRKPTSKEKKQLNLQRADDCVAVIKVESIDPYSAFEEAIHYMNTVLSLHKINQHNNKLFITPKAIIAKEASVDTIDEGVLIKSSPNPMKKQGNSSDLHAFFNDITLINVIDPPTKFYRAISLHSGAIESKDISNQLLNLWTMIEVLIDAKRDNEDKINTICTVLCAVLNRCYLYANLEQLLHDISICSEDSIEEFLLEIKSDDSSLDMVERFALLLSLDLYSETLDKVKNSLLEHPLLTYRIDFFSNQVLKDSKSIYDYLQRHKKRIRWHIMRIYRTRNMIVHSGSYMPYRNMIVENLHFYVDVLLDTLIEYYHYGLLNHSSIYRDICKEEIQHEVSLGVPIKQKEKQTCIPITEENALDLIFNGYSGNAVKKAIETAIKEHTEK